MTSSIIYTSQHAPDGRTIRYNVDASTKESASAVSEALAEGTLVQVPNEDGGEPIFVNPEFVTSIVPMKED